MVVIVWDGMRPDFVSEENTPALWKLAHEGVIFRNHHAVYPSATMVNGTALVTGMYPGKSGIIANHEYRPEIDRKHPIDVEIPAVVKKGDELSGGKYISFPTIAELVQTRGRPHRNRCDKNCWPFIRSTCRSRRSEKRRHAFRGQGAPA